MQFIRSNFSWAQHFSSSKEGGKGKDRKKVEHKGWFWRQNFAWSGKKGENPTSPQWQLRERQSAQEQLQQPGKSQKRGVQSMPALKTSQGTREQQHRLALPSTAWGGPAMPRPPRTVDAALKSRAEGRKHSMDISLSSSRSWSPAGPSLGRCCSFTPDLQPPALKS